MNAVELRTAAQLRALVEASAPAVTASPDLAERALTRVRSSRGGRKRLAAAGGVVVLAAGVAAAALTGSGDYREWRQPSGAMAPTVAVGQTVVVGKDLPPQRGDVVLLRAASGEQRFEALSRVVGLPGDTVACPAEPDGSCTVTVSGRPLQEPWLPVPTAPFAASTVGPGEVFVLGDARDQAVDSRMLGPQRLDAVLGVVVARVAESGRRESLPGTPVRELPGGETPVDPEDPVPPARTG